MLGPTPTNCPSIDLGSRPNSNLSAVSPISQGAEYAVSSFHSHNPATYLTYGYDTGPSGPPGGDVGCDEIDNVAGIVYDYTIDYIPAGYPKDSPAGLYESRNQRSISAE